MLTCSHCTYSTNRAYNFKRHINIHHDQYINTIENNIDSNNQIVKNVCPEVKNVCPEVKNVCLEVKNVCPEVKNVCPEVKNVCPNVLNIYPNESDACKYIYCNETKRYKCNGCYKIFIRKISIETHICKKINSPYECPNCHLVLSSRSCKSKHLKHCLSKELVVVEKKDAITVPNQSNNITNQNAKIINNNTINNNIVVFHFDNNPIQLQYDHLSQQMIKQMFFNTYSMEGIRNYAHEVLQRPENRCVKKKHIRDKHSYVHIGDNKWESRIDNEVFSRLTYNISSNLLEYIEEAQRKVHFSERLGKILNDIVCEKNPHYKQTIDRIKLIVLDYSESLLLKDK